MTLLQKIHRIDNSRLKQQLFLTITCCVTSALLAHCQGRQLFVHRVNTTAPSVSGVGGADDGCASAGAKGPALQVERSPTRPRTVLDQAALGLAQNDVVEAENRKIIICYESVRNMDFSPFTVSKRFFCKRGSFKKLLFQERSKKVLTAPST